MSVGRGPSPLTSNGPRFLSDTVPVKFTYCLKNSQSCIIRFKNLVITTAIFLNDFKISDIDQPILALIFRFGVTVV